ncbi:plexin-C1-like protein [Labeo rohita]|uniref:Plexin-C1-like protein n=1 Tax=Labeo rohita TaxID=84645 RepID=A0A498MIV6_LABRO|nr:plexin-C1-like protein [Labeo rohita]
MTLDLNEEKRKDITNAPHHNRVNILVPFDANGTLITCGTFENGYCEVLDINDITNRIYYENNILVGPRQDEKSVAFIAGRYLLVGKKDDDAKAQDDRYSVVNLWNTVKSQPGGIFSKISEMTEASIESTMRDVEFVDGFQRVSPSESYLFLNAKTDHERKVLVLWMNSSKDKKRDIIRSLQGATIRCCSDKVRPVLVASTIIPSVNNIIWAGVFSAQNQQDPENSALALYDISNVQGRTKGFCAYGENPCGSELILDEKFTAGCPIVLYKSDDERAVLPKMHFDPVGFKHIYIALRKQLRRVSVVPCAKYSTLKECRAALDPLCGWCVNTPRCSTHEECSKSSWVSTPKESLQKQLVSFQVWADKSSSKDACYDVLYETGYEDPEIFSLEPNKASFHGRNNVLLRGRNLESVTKIRIQGDLNCISKEAPVFNGSSDTLRFHIPPSETKETVKVCVVTPDDRCHGNSIITYSSQPSCTGIQPRFTWSSVDCGNLYYESDPEFTTFTTLQVENDLQVNIKKRADRLNLSMSEVNVTGQQGDQQYQCVLEKIETYTVICKIKGESGAVLELDSLYGHKT